MPHPPSRGRKLTTHGKDFDNAKTTNKKQNRENILLLDSMPKGTQRTTAEKCAHVEKCARAWSKDNTQREQRAQPLLVQALDSTPTLPRVRLNPTTTGIVRMFPMPAWATELQ